MTDYESSLNEIVKLISSNDSFFLLTHRRPDGDTLGTAFGLAGVIKGLGKKVAVLNDAPLPDKYAFLAKEAALPNLKQADCVIAIDCGAKDMIGGLEEKYGDRIDACIDHHKTNIGFAPINCIKCYAACAEIIIDIANRLSTKLSIQSARALYVGLSTDTGCFKYGNTNWHAHQSAAELMKICGDVLDLNYNLFTVKNIIQLKLERLVAEKLEIFADGHGSIACVTQADMKALGATMEDLEYVTDAVRALEGIYIGAFVKQSDENTFRVSLRGNVEKYDVSEICKIYGGGGHRGAGGCSLQGDEKSVCDRLKKSIEEYLCQA